VADLTGAELPDHRIDGLNIRAVLDGGTARSPRQELYLYYGSELRAVTDGQWKLVFPHTYQTVKTLGKDGFPGKSVLRKTDLNLYNLEEDPAEIYDVSKRFPEIVQRLEELAEYARNDLGDSLKGVEGKGKRAAGIIPVSNGRDS